MNNNIQNKNEVSNSSTVPIKSDYQIFENVNKISEFTQFVLWFSTPTKDREFKTQKEFALSIGVCEDTLTNWKQLPLFMSMVYKKLSIDLNEKLPDIVDNILERAINGDEKFIKIFLKITNLNLNQK